MNYFRSMNNNIYALIKSVSPDNLTLQEDQLIRILDQLDLAGFHTYFHSLFHLFQFHNQFIHEVLTAITDLSLSSQEQLFQTKKLIYYYQKIHQIQQLPLDPNALTNLLKQLPELIQKCRLHLTSQPQPYHQIPQKQQKPDQQTPTNTRTRYDKLFQHSIQLQDKQKMYQYQRELNEIRNCTFTPQKIARTKTSPKPISRKHQQRPQQSPKQEQVKKQRKSISPILKAESVYLKKGTSQMLDRMQKARQERSRIENYFNNQNEKQRLVSSKSASPFNFQAHRFPHPKPYLYVDVQIAVGKNQRIGLYKGDDLEQVAENFGKAHSLNKSQILGLRMRLESLFQ